MLEGEDKTERKILETQVEEKVNTTSTDNTTLKRMKKERRVDAEIDTNPYLAPLRMILKDEVFLELSGITRESIIESYLSYDSDPDIPVDIDYMMANVDNIIKQVSEDHNGYVYNSDGTRNEKLSNVQMREMQQNTKNQSQDLENLLKPSEKNTHEYKMIHVEKYKKAYTALEKIFNNGELNDEEKKIATEILMGVYLDSEEMAGLFAALGIENPEQEANEITCDEDYAFIETKQDLQLLKYAYELEKAGNSEKRAEILQKMNTECADSKYIKSFRNEKGYIDLESAKQGRKDWEDKRNYTDTVLKIIDFQNKLDENNGYQSLTLEERKSLIKTLYRANDTSTPTLKRMAENLAKNYKLKVFEENSQEENQLSDKALKEVYRSLLEEYANDTKIEGILNNDDYGAETPANIKHSLKLLENLSQYVTSDQRLSPEDKKAYRIGIKAKNIVKNEEIKRKKVLSYNRMILEKLDKIDFSKRENQEQLIQYYAELSKEDQDRSIIGTEINGTKLRYGNERLGSEGNTLKKYIIENPQYFSRVINNSESINHNQVVELLRERKAKGYNCDGIKKKIDLKRIKAISNNRSRLNKVVKLKSHVFASDTGEKKIYRSTTKKDKHISPERNFMKKLANKLNFCIEGNQLAFLAAYVQLKYYNSQDPKFSEEEKKTDSQICAAMENIMSSQKNKVHFRLYLDENGVVLPNNAEQAYVDYMENSLKGKGGAVTLEQLMSVINQFKERGIDEVENDIQTQSQEKDNSAKVKEISLQFSNAVKIVGKGKVKDASSIKTEGISEQKATQRSNGIRDSVVIAAKAVVKPVMSLAEKIRDTIKDNVVKLIEKRGTLALASGSESQYGTETSDGAENKALSQEEQRKSWELSGEQVQEINNNAKNVANSSSNNVRTGTTEVGAYVNDGTEQSFGE